MWKVISDADRQNFILTCDTEAGDDTTQNAYGLPNGHAFSLIGAYELKSDDGKLEY